MQAYLAHLRDAGFTDAPLPVGVDDRGREVLSFVPGDVPRNPLPPATAGDDVLAALARLIRALHEASAGRQRFADADIPHRAAVFADAYGMTARHRADLAPLVVDLAHRYYENARASAELDPVFRKLWEDGARDEFAAGRGLAARGGPGDHRSPGPARPGRAPVPAIPGLLRLPCPAGVGRNECGSSSPYTR